MSYFRGDDRRICEGLGLFGFVVNGFLGCPRERTGSDLCANVFAFCVSELVLTSVRTCLNSVFQDYVFSGACESLAALLAYMGCA